MSDWDTIAEGRPSPRKEIIYNVEPFRGALRQGNWKLIWRTMLPSSVDLYNVAEDPSEKNNLAAANPDKVAAMQKRLDALAKEAAKPLFLVDQFKVVMKNVNGEGPAMTASATTTTRLRKLEALTDQEPVIKHPTSFTCACPAPACP